MARSESLKQVGIAFLVAVQCTSLVGGIVLATPPSSSASGRSEAPAGLEPAAGRFTSLETCNAAFERLEAKLCEGDDPPLSDAGAHWRSRHGLVHDGDGTPIVQRAVNFPRQPEKLLYKPPTGYSGVPSEKHGWDYRLHGDDWAGFGECGGSNQSPVDLPRYVGSRGQTKYLLWFDYYVDPSLNDTSIAQIINDGHGLRFDVQPNQIDLGFVKIGAKEYVASEYIFHAPSEHSMDGAVFPLELQIYNDASDAGTVAIAIFFREGRSNPLLADLRTSMKDSGPTWTVKYGRGVGLVTGNFTAAFNLEALIPKGNAARERSFYNYKGSLTQPPCTTGVDWWVLSSPITASREEIRFVRSAIYGSRSTKHGNARATMPLGERTVTAGLVGFQHAVRGHQIPGWKKLDQYKQPRGYSAGDAPWGSHWSAGVPKHESEAEEEEEEDYLFDEPPT
mmetsp:Transcript_77120/g.200561  ORF Transcript_77120/g.200561 Transcript_77120/m.200561 type:complete len:449 (+) Transcript_77120:212-1558(+)